MPIEMVPAIVAAAYDDIVIRPVIAVIRPSVRPGVAGIVIRSAIVGVSAIEIRRPRASGQHDKR